MCPGTEHERVEEVFCLLQTWRQVKLDVVLFVDTGTVAVLGLVKAHYTQEAPQH